MRAHKVVNQNLFIIFPSQLTRGRVRYAKNLNNKLIFSQLIHSDPQKTEKLGCFKQLRLFFWVFQKFKTCFMKY